MKPSKNAAPASDRTKRIPESVGHAVTPGERPPPSRSLPPELARLYTGIDVAQEPLEVAVLDGLGNVVSGSASYPNTPEGHDRLWTDTQALAARLQLPIAYAMEASGIYHLDLLYFIIERKAHAWSFNALLLKEEKGGSIRKTKTDPIDARRIAEYLQDRGFYRSAA